MCNFDNGFILCTCNPSTGSSSDEKEVSNTTTYIWTLNRLIGENKGTEVGKYLGPSDSLHHGLTSEFVIDELNSKNCFDFEYSPSEGDHLMIRDTKDHRKLEFIFKENSWTKDHYSPFEYTLEKISNGKVKKTDSKPINL